MVAEENLSRKEEKKWEKMKDKKERKKTQRMLMVV